MNDEIICKIIQIIAISLLLFALLLIIFSIFYFIYRNYIKEIPGDTESETECENNTNYIIAIEEYSI